ncbi:hypothetical protein BSM4216_1577 [Bacillus smithii]|nr:hypothetical protein BSM4216_1577 [Bacillus smithii]
MKGVLYFPVLSHMIKIPLFIQLKKFTFVFCIYTHKKTAEKSAVEHD